MNDLNIGEFIANLRKEKNMTQKDLAEKLNVTDKAISKWERNLGYPDITMISSLSKILGVTEGELLNGRKVGDQAFSFDTETDTLEAKKSFKTHKKISKSLVMSIISIAFLITLFVCFICNYAISGTLDWSLYPTFSIIFAWSILFASLYSKKQKIVKTLIVLSILIIPLLFSIEYCTPSKGWVAGIGIPASIISLAYIWTFVLLFLYSKINKWYLASIAILCTILLNYGINFYTDKYINNTRSNFEIILNVSITVIVALVVLFVGVLVNSRKTKVNI